MGDAAVVAGGLRQLAVVARIKLDRDAGQGLAVGERADIYRQTVAALVGGEPEVRDENPVGRRLGGFVLPQVGALGDREIDAGTLLAQQVLERDRRRRRAVALTGYRHLALPDEAAAAVDDLVDLIGRKAHRQPLGVNA